MQGKARSLEEIDAPLSELPNVSFLVSCAAFVAPTGDRSNGGVDAELCTD